MKKLVLWFKKSLVICSVSLILSPQLSFAADYVSISANTVNIRTGPGKTNPIYMELFKGYPLQIIQRKGEWLKIKDFENDTGWIFASLTRPIDTVIVNSKGKINMRSLPSTQEKNIVANLERGVVLQLLKKKGKWVKVRHESGVEGWVYGPLVWPN